MGRGQPTYDVNERTVFITGAARGIGAETARRLHGKGANVALVGLELERLQALAAELGDRAAAFEADVSDYDALQRAVGATAERFGGIDVGIANAGVGFPGTIAGGPVEQIERTFAVNFLGVWHTDRLLIGPITERDGYLLNVGSLAAVVHGPMMGAYSAAKAAVDALSDTLRIESAPSGAAVGCAYFGFIDTDFGRASLLTPSHKVMSGEMKQTFVAKQLKLSKAVDAIERGIERRAARIWAPGWAHIAYLLRGPLQPLSERYLDKTQELLRDAMRVTEESHSNKAQPDPLLGLAMNAVADSDLAHTG